MTSADYRRTKRACYFSYFSMTSVFCLPPLLFATFRESYGISFTLLGTLVLVNFLTQLGIDLVFTFFHKHFNLKIVVRVMPLLTSVGLFIYALRKICRRLFLSIYRRMIVYCLPNTISGTG